MIKKRLPVSKESGCNKIFVKPKSFTAYQFQPINAQRPFSFSTWDFIAEHLVFSFGKNVSIVYNQIMHTETFS
jgi:hypothetical protein